MTWEQQKERLAKEALAEISANTATDEPGCNGVHSAMGVFLRRRATGFAEDIRICPVHGSRS